MTYFPSLFIIQQVGQAGWSPSYCEQCVVTPKEKRYELPIRIPLTYHSSKSYLATKLFVFVVKSRRTSKIKCSRNLLAAVETGN